MALRRSDSSLLTQASTSPRRSRLTLVVVSLTFLAAVAFIASHVLPERGAAPPRRRTFEDPLKNGADYERQSLDRSAAEAYAAAMDDPGLEAEVRYQAAMHVVRLDLDRLGDQRGAEAALEKAWLFAPEADKAAVAARIERLRGYPVRQAEPAPLDIQALLKSEAAAKDQSDKGRRVIAQIGDQAVTFEDLIYAWSQSHANQPPDSEAFGPFVANYLNLVLLADEAQRQGLDQAGGSSLALRMNRALILSRALEERLVAKLPQPTEGQLRAFYDANPAPWAVPPRLTLGHIVVAEEDQADSVAKALKNKESFAETARRFGRDASKHDEGYLIGDIVESDETIPHVGDHPGLAPILFTLDDGQTTGPIKLADGYHFFKAVKKQAPGAVAPFAQVRDQVALAYQQGALARSRAALLSQLRASRPIEIRDAMLDKIMARGDFATTATASAASATSSSLAAGAKPARR